MQRLDGSHDPSDVEEFDLVIVGSGTGNSIPVPEMDGWRIAIVEKGVFGGTCLNVGCIPSKMFVHTADVAHDAADSGRYGIKTSFEGADWPSIVTRVFGRIDPIAAGGEQWRESLENFELVRGTGHFVDHKLLDVDGRLLRAPRFVLAAGARPVIPAIAGLEDVRYHTSDTVMRIERLPERLVVIGGGYIAAELGHVFGSLGVEVTILLRRDRMLRFEDAEISDLATEQYAARFDVRPHSRARSIRPVADGFVLDVERDGDVDEIEGDLLLIATGRVPNSDLLEVGRTGVRTHADGRVVVDDSLATGVPGIWAFGDLTNPFQLRHLANAEARVLSHNLLHPDDPRHVDYSLVPHAVFGSPQVASVGLTEEQAAALPSGDYETATRSYADTAWGWALEDTTSIVKLVGDRQTRRLLGAHIIGPQAATLIQQLIQGMNAGQTVDEMAHGQLWIHPAPNEVVENALLDLISRLP